jgi:hypothetical protein
VEIHRSRRGGGTTTNLHGDQLVATSLEALDNLANEAALNAIRLDHNVRLLHGIFGDDAV